MGSCPRCDGGLERYELGDRAETTCIECGYVGVAVEHGSEPDDPESWGEALERFYEEHSDDPRPAVEESAEAIPAVVDGRSDTDTADGSAGDTPDGKATGEKETDSGKPEAEPSENTSAPSNDDSSGRNDRWRTRRRGRKRDSRRKRGRKRASGRKSR